MSELEHAVHPPSALIARVSRGAALLLGTLLLAVLPLRAAQAQGYFPMPHSWDQPGGPGSALTLTYSFSNLFDGGIRDRNGAVDVAVLRSAFEQALADYAAVLPIHFVEVVDQGPAPGTGEYDPTGLADIRVGHLRNVVGANAYAYYPSSASSGLAGDVIFNSGSSAPYWTETFFYAVAQHELGHSLGMAHFVAQPGLVVGDDTGAAALSPLYGGTLFPLDELAVAALQAVYGAGVGSVTPLSAVPEPASVALWSAALLLGLLAQRVRQRRRGTALLAAAGLGLALASAPARAIEIRFDYSYDTRGFFTDLQTGAPLLDRRATLEAAGAVYAGFADTLTAIAPGGDDHWRLRFGSPSRDGQVVVLDDLAVAADSITIFVGGSTTVPGVLGFASTATIVSASGSEGFLDAVYNRGQADTTGANASDYGVWGGTIWFNGGNNWYFGSDVAGLGATQNDFFTTAVHEIGHILGFGTADSWFAQIDAEGRFAGTASVLANGGTVALDSYGDHWARGTDSLTLDGVLQNTLMDPSTPAGRRELMTELDLAGFADIGWQVSAVPEPASLALFGGGLALLLAAGRKRQGRLSA